MLTDGKWNSATIDSIPVAQWTTLTMTFTNRVAGCDTKKGKADAEVTRQAYNPKIHSDEQLTGKSTLSAFEKGVQLLKNKQYQSH
jgi:hypothetical protein